jgi:AcrR family transcriptional regulator
VADSYHHGDLRKAVLQRAVEVIAAEGPHHFSLRSLAADLGVSHTAPRHHFGDRRGVLNAIAAEGFAGLAESLDAAGRGGSFLDQGVAYVTYAVAHPAHFQVMFAPGLLDETDAALAEARSATFARLRAGVESMREGTGDEGEGVEDAAAAVVAAWALVHGVATLGLTGNLDASDLRALFADADLASITRRSAALLYGSSPGDA